MKNSNNLNRIIVIIIIVEREIIKICNLKLTVTKYLTLRKFLYVIKKYLDL